MKKILLFLSFLLMSIGVYADSHYINITTSALNLSGTTYRSSSSGISVDGTTIKFTDCNNNSGINMKASSGCIWNSSAMPQNIDSIVMSSVGYSSSSGSGFYVYGSTSEKGTTTTLYDNNSTGKIKIDFTAYSYKYFYIKNKNTRTTHSTSIKVYYSTASYTITAQSNNTTYGTVSLDDKVITATPNSGYRIDNDNPYTVFPSGSATVVHGTDANINKFTVTPSANCTITINFEPIPTYTLSFINTSNPSDIPNSITDVENTEIDVTDKNADTNENCKKNGWEFVGWTDNEYGESAVTSVVLTSNCTLYALYKLMDIGSSYVTDTFTYEKIGLGHVGTKETYTDFSDYSDNSNATYNGQINRFRNNQPDSSFIQMRSGTSSGTKHAGIVTTSSGGIIDSIRVVWHKSTPNGRVLQVHPSDTPYHEPDNLWNDGVKLNYVTITKGTNNSVKLSDVEYVGLRSKENALMIDSIFIVWKTLGSSSLYSTNPKCYDAGVSIVHWYKDSIKFDIDEIGTSTDVILYTANDTVSTYSHVSDSSYRFTIPHLDTLECTDLKFVTTKANGDECIRRYQIPIMISTTTNKLCDSCAVVVLSGGQLNIDKDTVSGDVTIYEGGILNVKSEGTYHINSLILRRDNDSLPYLLYNGTLDIKNEMFFEMRTDGSDWRWLTLPDTFKINTIDANNETDYSGLALVKYYNGNIRANNGRGGWKLAPKDTTFSPGKGIIFGSYIPESSTEKKIYKIKLDTNILTKEKNNKEILVYPYGYGIDKPVNDLGWNVVGNPFMSKCNISSINPIRIGYLEENDGKWIIKEDDLKYIIIKDNSSEYADAGYYKSIPLNIDGCNLEPFIPFFVQIPVTNLEPVTLTFTKGSGISYAPSKERLNSDSFIRIKINNKQLGLFVSDRYSDEYEIGNDLESLDNVTYQLINGYKLQYSSVNDSILEQGITIYSNQGIVQLEEKTTIEQFAEINILHQGEWASLLNGKSIEVSGNFILLAKRKLNDISTNIENIDNSSYIYKTIQDGCLYIHKNGIIYNILGGRK